MSTLVDANVLLDLVTRDAVWSAWSLAQLDAAGLAGPVFINDIVYAELSIGYAIQDQLDAFVNSSGLSLQTISRQALFLAGKAYRRYRTAGGPRTGVLADFFIGAHALVAGHTLLTRDARRYRTYFPRLDLISP